MDSIFVSVVHISDVEKKVSVMISPEEVKRQYDLALNMLKPHVELNGFRKGKIPKEIMEVKYKDQIKSQVDVSLMNLAFHKALTDNKFELIGSPDVHKAEIGLDGNYNFEMDIEIKPIFDPQGYIGMRLKKHPDLDLDNAVQKRFVTFQNRVPQIDRVNRECKDGDIVVVKYDGKINGEEFEGNKNDRAEFELGRNEMIRGFEEVILGLKPEEDKTTKVKFPDDYRDKNLAGKEVDFYIKILEVKEKILPEVDDRLAKRLGYGDMQRMTEKVREEVKMEHEHAARIKYEEQVLTKLFEANPFSVPKKMLKLQTDHLLENMKKRFGYNDDLGEDIIDFVKQQALEQLKRVIVLEKIYLKEKENIKDVNNYGDTVDRLSKQMYMDKDDFVKMQDSFNLAMKIQEEHVIDFILSKSELE